MPLFSPESLASLAAACPKAAGPSKLEGRPISIWEITSWILPMAPEHLRRVLAAEPSLPQGSAGAEGGTRWFQPADLVALRAHFARGPRKARYLAPRPAAAPLVVMAGPLGAMGRSTTVVHLATAAALSGQRVLVIDGDPGGDVSRALPLAVPAAAGAGVLSLIARSSAVYLRRQNQLRLERGDAPQAMDEGQGAALTLKASDLIRPSLWPGLDVMAAPSALLQADRQIAGWRLGQRNWTPGGALAQALEDEGLRQRYDLILCDAPRGLGALALALLTSADVVLAPFPLRGDGQVRLGEGLQALAEAVSQQQAEAQTAARALGQTAAQAPAWQALWVLPNRAGEDAARQMVQAGAHLAGAHLGEALLPNPLPEIAALADGTAAQFYDIDYRKLGRLTYAPLRESCDAAWRGVAERLLALRS